MAVFKTKNLSFFKNKCVVLVKITRHGIIGNKNFFQTHLLSLTRPFLTLFKSSTRLHPVFGKKSFQ